MSQDTWITPIDNWCRANGAEFIRLEDVMTEALGFDPRVVQRPLELRAARILRQLGYVKITKRVGSRVCKVWTLDPTA